MDLDGPNELELKKKYFSQNAEEVKEFISTLKLVKYLTRARITDAKKTAIKGQEAPNTLVYSLDGKPVGILDLQRKNLLNAKTRPMILHFGSCSWQPFMTSLAKFADMAETFAGIADFVVVYIAEAHPVESNDFKGIVEVPRHVQLVDRIQAASYLVQEEAKYLTNCRVYVDNMNDDSAREYAALPERAYLIHEDRVAVEGYMGPFKHMKTLRKIEKWLNKYANSSRIPHVEEL